MQNTDDTMPLAKDAERIFNEHAGDDLKTRDWLQERGIDAANAREVALIDYILVCDVLAGRCEFKTYPADHIGPKQFALAVPIYEAGKFVDLLLIYCEDLSFQLVTGRASWLGRENITGKVRLHATDAWLGRVLINWARCPIRPESDRIADVPKWSKSATC
jgi:hypothetical protein